MRFSASRFKYLRKIERHDDADNPGDDDHHHDPGNAYVDNDNASLPVNKCLEDGCHIG